MCVSVYERTCVMEAYFCTELQLHRIPMHNLHKYLWNCDIDWVPHLKGKSHTLATLFDTLFCSHNMIEDCLFEQLGEILLSVCCCLADKGRFRSPPIDFQSSKTLKFGIKKKLLKNYWKGSNSYKGQISPNCTRPTGSCNFVSLWKIYSCLFIPNCTQNHVITYTSFIALQIGRASCRERV